MPSRESPAGTCKGKAKEIEKIYEVLSIRGHTSRGKCGVKEKNVNRDNYKEKANKRRFGWVWRR